MSRNHFRNFRFILGGLALLAGLGMTRLIAQATLPAELEDPECLGINKEPWHATLMPYANQGEALRADRTQSSFCQSLNSQTLWQFNWVPRPEVRPVDFYQTNFDASQWKTIPVPSNWQIQGYGTPFYRNLGYTFQKNWPYVLTEPPERFTSYLERDQVGSYRREFEVPAAWAGREVFVKFDGVDSACFVWVNGQKVGYSLNSRNAAEFDITKYIQPGKNLLAVEVYQYSSGSYLEDQDMWRLSGIFRNVTLWCAPTTHVRDFTVKTDLDENYRNARLSVSAKVKNYSDKPAPARDLEVELFDASRSSINKARVGVPALAAGEEKTVELSFPVNNPIKWTAETPYLYTTMLTLGEGRVQEILSARTGFRKIEIKGRVFTINGVPVKLKGANRHENWPDSGHFVAEDRMIKDLELLKQGNCNHVRTCHYSDDPRWYELCDQYGIYLVAEANCECHGYGGVLDREPRYEKAIVDRNVANVENFKNHASAIIWSLGNECGGGTNFVIALNKVKSLDDTRPVHYEAFGSGKNNPADIDSHMYTRPSDVEKIALNDGNRYTKPFYMCEYAHAMFNSMGSIGDYNDIFDKYPTLMGGAIWEWEDQGVWNRRNPTHPFIAFGGGFGEYPNDHYFIHKGVIFSDRSPKPHYPEMKRAYQWISITPEDLAAGKVKIRNRYAFINLAGFQGRWEITEDGSVIDKGTLPQLNLAPGAEQVVEIPQMTQYSPKPGAEYELRVAFDLNHKELWADTGYEMAVGQFTLPRTEAAVAADPAKMEPLQIQDGTDAITVRGQQGIVMVFSKTAGTFTELSRDGKNILKPGGGPQLHLWRAPHRNDDMWAYSSWVNNGLDQMKSEVEHVNVTQPAPAVVRIESVVKLTGKNNFTVRHTAIYTIYGDGSIAVDNAVQPRNRKIPIARLGVRLQLDQALNYISYFGRGPMENYADRKRGSDLGLYGGSVRDQMTPYAKPMECGNHEDIRWAALRDNWNPSSANLPTLMVQADGAPLQVSALPYTDETMTPIEYSVDLPPSDRTVLTIAARTLGVGSASCGPRPLEQYMVYSEPAVFSYTLRLLSPNEKPAEAGRPGIPILARTSGEISSRRLTDAARQAMPAGRQRPAVPEPDTAGNGPAGKVIAASSFEPGEGDPEHAVDGDPGTFWHSRWSNNEAQPPHFLVIDYGHEVNIAEVIYTARSDGDNGHVRDYEIYLSNDGKEWNTPVVKGRIRRNAETETIHLPQPVPARYMKFVILNEQNGRPFATVAELEVVEAKAR